MPNYFMPAKDPEEVRNFFKDLQEQDKLKITLAPERPDVYDRIQPTEEVRLVVDVADAKPPENVIFDKILPEFRPTPLPEDQLASWSDEIMPAESSEPDSVADEMPAQAEEKAEETTELMPALSHAEDGGAALDRKWTPFTERGFKG